MDIKFNNNIPCIGMGWFNTCHLCKEKQDVKLIIQVHLSLIHFVFGSQKIYMRMCIVIDRHVHNYKYFVYICAPVWVL